MRMKRVADGTFVEGRHRKYFISQEKIAKLDQIGFIWDMSAFKGNGFSATATSSDCRASSEPPTLFVEMEIWATPFITSEKSIKITLNV